MTKVIAYKNLPVRLLNPTWSAIILYLLFEHLGNSDWVYHVMFTLYGLIQLSVIYTFCTQKTTDLFKETK